ncbi:unnamed protein product [Penicillium egyptiacum]|uniref:Uncharacterized protein n=1 Tax=Penicillium egyptiacum TaxID=1303716 RepID=A0A9W4K2C9_9EURO|nr:unnamed protein product [Penicillium egyptiacum]
MTQQAVTNGHGPSFAAAKFLCHRKENSSKQAFMRIYLQIPISGTQYQSSRIRRQQAAEPQLHVELRTLKALKELKCDVVPDLLAHREGKQGEDSIVPGGYMTYVVWDKVPREPLSFQGFWELDLESRKPIRDKFREAFPSMVTYRVCQPHRRSSMIRLPGIWFSRAGRTDTNEEWHDKYYVMFHLAKPSPRTDWVNAPTGWTS